MKPLDIKSALLNWHEEKNSAFLYRYMAQSEKGNYKETLFLNLASAAQSQAAIWENLLSHQNIPLPAYTPDFRTKLVAKLIPWLGARAIKPVLAAMKVRGLSVYLGNLPGHPISKAQGKIIEPQHKAIGSGGTIRAAVFGINDGLVSNVGLILGVAGATNNTSVIILSGIAGLSAGALSMASGEYISMKSQKELFEYQIALEKAELEEYPEEEAKELSYIYQARGLSKVDADNFADKMLANKEHALNTLAREELGLNPDDLGSPWGAALSSFCAFAIGGFIPLLPFLFHFESVAKLSLILSIVLTGLSLFVVGMILSLYTGRHAVLSGLRMLMIGTLAGITTFLIGHFVGVNL